jgi:hypothetical protein
VDRAGVLFDPVDDSVGAAPGSGPDEQPGTRLGQTGAE